MHLQNWKGKTMKINFEYNSGNSLLQVNDVSLRFGDFLCLRDINLEIKDIIRPEVTQGQVVGFLGPSGIGKTQLSRLIAGFTPIGRHTGYVAEGSINIWSATNLVKRGQVGIVDQHYEVFWDRSVWANIYLAARQGEKVFQSEEGPKKRATEMLNRLNLYHARNNIPAEISGGQRQRLRIAMEIMCNHTFLIMDEPFSGLDPFMAHEVCRLIREMSTLSEETTLIVVSHDVDSAVDVADTLWLLGIEREENGARIPGATIVEQIDLIEHGFVWHDEIRDMPTFYPFVRELEKRYADLK